MLDDMKMNLNIDYKKVQFLEANIVTLEVVGVIEAMVDGKEANDDVVTKNVIIVRHDLNMWHIIVIKKEWLQKWEVASRQVCIISNIARNHGLFD